MNAQAVNSNFRLMSSLDLKNSDVPVIDFADFVIESGMFSSREELSEYIRKTSIPYVEGSEDFYPNGSMHSETYEEYCKRMERNAQNADISNIAKLPVADFSQRQSYSTGDSEKDYLIGIGGKYRKSCWDGAHWTELDELTKAADYTGMSDAEKYRAIYEKYQYCFGENFLDTEAIGFSRPTASEDSYHLTVLKFYDELKENFGSRAKSMEIRCEALYGTTDKYEVRQAIIDKYTDGRNITLGNFYKMANEMYECGVGGDIMNWVDESMDWVAAREYGAETIWEYLDYLKNCAVGVNDPSTIKYQRLNQNVSGEFIEQMKYFAFTGKGNFGDAMNQILNSIDVETSSPVSRSRGAVSNSLLEEMRSRSVGVRASV